MKATRPFWAAGITVLLLLFLASTPGRAQSTFSVNIAAYVDLPLAAGTNLIANPLNAAYNTVSNLFSQPSVNSVPNGSYFISLAPGSPTFGVSNGYSSATGWSNPNDVFVAPNAAVLWLPSATTISFIGEPWGVATGPSCVLYPARDSFSGWFPQESSPCSICINPPCPAPYPEGTLIWKWNRISQAEEYYEYYDFGGTPEWTPATPQIAVGEGFGIYTPISFPARSPFAGGAGNYGPLRHSRPFGALRDVQRSGTNMIFRFAATNGTSYSLLCTTNLRSGLWQIAQTGTVNTVDGFATLSPVSSNAFSFYKIHPLYGGANPILVPRLSGRRGSFFSFDFYAPTGATYQIDRSLSFSGASWTPIASVPAAANTFITFTDQNATAAEGYYRVRY